jgi:dTMP kinase
VASVLITVEGVEGSGKSTQSQRLADRLRGRGHRVTLTSEPDGTPLGLAVRAVFDADGHPPTPLAQAFLFRAARQQHVARVIRPALARDEVVISDRYTDATLAYQGYGQGLDLEIIRELNLLATGGVLPDLTLLLDLDPAAGMERIGGRRLDAFERMGLDFHRRVRQGYLDIAVVDKARVTVLDASRPPEAVERDIALAVEAVLGRREKSRGA